VNNVAVFPISQNYYLLVNQHDVEIAQQILQENNEITDEENPE